MGKAIKYFSKLGVGEFQIEAADMSVGDRLLVTGPTTGALFMDLEEVRYDLKPVETVGKGMRVSFKVPEKIRPNDKLYKLVKSAKEALTRRNIGAKRRPVTNNQAFFGKEA